VGWRLYFDIVKKETIEDFHGRRHDLFSVINKTTGEVAYSQVFYYEAINCAEHETKIIELQLEQMLLG
jgi:hypothetical protein